MIYHSYKFSDMKDHQSSSQLISEYPPNYCCQVVILPLLTVHPPHIRNLISSLGQLNCQETLHYYLCNCHLLNLSVTVPPISQSLFCLPSQFAKTTGTPHQSSPMQSKQRLVILTVYHMSFCLQAFPLQFECASSMFF